MFELKMYIRETNPDTEMVAEYWSRISARGTLEDAIADMHSFIDEDIEWDYCFVYKITDAKTLEVVHVYSTMDELLKRRKTINWTKEGF